MAVKYALEKGGHPTQSYRFSNTLRDFHQALLACAGVGVHGEVDGAVAGEFLRFFGTGCVFR